MKPLAERHFDRAQRIAENRAERTGFTSPGIGGAVIAMRAGLDAYHALDDAGRAEADAALKDYIPNGARSLAEDEDGNSMAGIGVVNTKVVPASAESGNGSGGEVPGWTSPPKTEQFDGNISGKALDDQLGEGWGAVGSGGNGGEGESDPAKMSIANLTAHLEGVNDVGEVDRLLDAENAKGDNKRAGAVAALEARKAALQSA